MNLVAKEYVATHTDEDGVLVLSEFAGAGDEMKEGAVLVNPYSIEDMVTALEWALTMSPEERIRRMKLMRDVVKKHDINYWLTSIVARTLKTSSLSRPSTGDLA
jgi:trehalose 6-phosphate synthase